jgi:hypothetical protein
MPGLPAVDALPILSHGESSVFGGAAVAKKTIAKPKAKLAPGPARRPVPSQPNVITIRGSADWKRWLEAFAAKMRSKPTAVIDLALAKLAQQEGFSEPPPRMPSQEGGAK